MVPKSYIIEWSNVVPWTLPWQIEQDLIITRALIELYSNPIIAKSLAFRGGTALNKLIFKPSSRYSEDIDLVQVRAEPIGSLIDIIRAIMKPWLGEPKRDVSHGLVTLSYKCESDEGLNLKIKIEINTREHFAVMGFKEYNFDSSSSWCPGTSSILSYHIEEMLGTKLRALYQRRKGRDLYDLYHALIKLENIDCNAILQSFKHYTNNSISKKDLIDNIEIKLQNKEFRGDIIPLLPQIQNQFNPDDAYQLIRTKLLENLV